MRVFANRSLECGFGEFVLFTASSHSFSLDDELFDELFEFREKSELLFEFEFELELFELLFELELLLLSSIPSPRRLLILL